MTAYALAYFERIGLVDRLKLVVALLERLPLSALQLLFRIAIGSVFWSSGLTKLASWQATVALFRDEYQVPLLPPEAAALLGTTFELACPVFLVLGLATRLATLPLLGMTFVIEVFVYPEYWTQHLLWASALLFLLARGAGVVSIDHFIARRLFGR
jgi:putative oxidoreductase